MPNVPGYPPGTVVIPDPRGGPPIVIPPGGVPPVGVGGGGTGVGGGGGYPGMTPEQEAQRRAAEEAAKAMADRRKAEEAARRQAEEKAAEAKRAAEEAQRRADEEAAKAMAARRKAEEAAKKAAEEKSAEARRTAEEATKRAAEAAAKAMAARRKAEVATKKAPTGETGEVPATTTTSEETKSEGPNLIGGKQLTDEQREFKPDPEWEVAERNARGEVITYVDKDGVRWYTPDNIQWKYYGVKNSKERIEVTRVEYIDPETGEIWVNFEGGAGRYDDPTEGRAYVTVLTPGGGSKHLTLLEADKLFRIKDQDEFDGAIRQLLDVKEGYPVLPLERRLASKIGNINLVAFVEAGIDNPEDFRVAGYKVYKADIERAKAQLAAFKRELTSLPLYVQHEYERAREEGRDGIAALN
ncbi:MAG: hypothetical protein PHI12_13195, partial [Dehalococcoidales bacterium]|nr:hypothetical protein [Dehalococcoidales bacterium]